MSIKGRFYTLNLNWPMIAYLFRSALSRHPTRTELADFARHFQGMDRASDQMEVLEDEVEMLIFTASLPCWDVHLDTGWSRPRMRHTLVARIGIHFRKVKALVRGHSFHGFFSRKTWPELHAHVIVFVEEADPVLVAVPRAGAVTEGFREN